jgi:hypothetical protein
VSICLASAHESVSVDITLSIGLSSQTQQEDVIHHQKFFGVFPRVPTNEAPLHNVRWTNICMSLAKNLSSHVLSHACFSRTSFHLCLLQLNFPSQVCFSLLSMSTSGKQSFTCLPRQNTIQPNWLSKEPLSFYFICICVSMPACLYLCVCMYMSMFACVCVCLCVSVCAFMCLCIGYICVWPQCRSQRLTLDGVHFLNQDFSLAWNCWLD